MTYLTMLLMAAFQNKTQLSSSTKTEASQICTPKKMEGTKSGSGRSRAWDYGDGDVDARLSIIEEILFIGANEWGLSPTVLRRVR